MRDFRNKMREKMAMLRMDESFATRYVNEGFSGGEKKRLEMLQMAVLEPEMAILDETDSGLDIDALRIVAEGVNAMLNPELGVLLITHYQRLLNYITPDCRPRPGPGPDRQERRQGPRPAARGRGLRPDPARGRPRARRPRRGAARAPGAGRASSSRAPARGGRPLAGRTAMADRDRADPSSPPRRVRPGRRSARDFPILAAGDPRPPAASTSTRRRRSQKPQVVIDAMDAYYREYNANVHRGIYRSARRRRPRTRRRARKVARFINAPDAHEIVFTRNATEAINLVAYSWGRRNIDRGDAIVLTEMEHHANLVPWQLLVQEQDGDLEFIPITDDGVLRLDVFEVLLRLKPEARRVHPRVEHARDDQPGPRDDRDGPRRRARSSSIDGAQAVPHVPVDVQEIGADFYAFSGHKMLGPTGSGALWARRELLEAMPPFLAGGEMIREVHLRRREWNDIPWKFEAGTPAIGDAIGLGVGGRVPAATIGHGRASASTSASSSTYALERAAARGPGHRALRADGPGRCAAASCRSTCPGIHPHDVAQVLDRFGIAVRAGHHCTMPLHERLDLAATARASFNVYTTTEPTSTRSSRASGRCSAIFGADTVRPRRAVADRPRGARR